MLSLLGCESSALTAASAGTAKWIYLLFQSLPFPPGSSCWIRKSTDQLMRSERYLQKWQKIAPGAEISAGYMDWGEKLSLYLYLNWSLAALQGLSCWAGDLLELSCSLHMWDYQGRQIARVGWATAIHWALHWVRTQPENCGHQQRLVQPTTALRGAPDN